MQIFIKHLFLSSKIEFNNIHLVMYSNWLINQSSNIGYKIIDHIKELYNFPDFTKKFKSEFSKSEFNKNILFLSIPL